MAAIAILSHFGCVNGQTLMTTLGANLHVGEIRAIATWQNFIFTAAQDTIVKVWQVQDGQFQFVRNLAAHTDIVETLYLVPPILYSGGRDNKVIQWNLTTFTLTRTMSSHTGWVRTMTHTGNNLFSGGQEGLLVQWNIDIGTVRRQNNAPNPAPAVRAVTTNAAFVFVGGEDGTIRQWNVETGNVVTVYSYSSNTGAVRGLYLDGSSLYGGGCDNGRIRRWDYSVGTTLLNTYTAQAGGQCVTSFTGDSVSLYSGGADRNVRFFNLTSRTLGFTLSGHSNTINSVFLKSDEIYSVDMSGEARIWDLNSQQSKLTSKISTSSRRLTLATADKLFVTFGYNIEVYDLSTLQLIMTIDAGASSHSADITAIASRGNYLATASLDTFVKIWDASSGALLYSQNNGYPVKGVAIVGDYVYAGTATGNSIAQWSLIDGAWAQTLAAHSDSVTCMTASTTKVYSGSDDSTVKEWNTGLGSFSLSRTYTLTSGPRVLLTSGNALWVGCIDGGIRQFNLGSTSSSATRTYNVPGGAVMSLAFKNNVLFAGEGLGSYKIQQFSTTSSSNAPLKTFGDHMSTILGLAISDRFLFSASESEALVRRWHIPEFGGLTLTTLAPSITATALPTSTPGSQNTPDNLLNSPVFIGAIIGTIAFLALVGVCIVIIRRRAKGNTSDHFYGGNTTGVTSASYDPPTYLAQRQNQVFQPMPSASALMYFNPPTQSSFSPRSSIIMPMSNQQTESFIPSQTSPPQDGQDPDFSPTLMNNATLTESGGGEELSVPLFLEMKWGLDFRQEKFITKGGGGSIYLATCIDGDLIERTQSQAVVVKNCAEDIEWMQDRLKRAFFQELTLMWRFRQHPNFVKVYAYSTRPVCLLMKFYEAGDLAAYSRGRGRAKFVLPYSKLRIIRMMSQFCAAIAYMHNVGGIAHCDIKPANVLLEYSPIYGEWIIIVTDFGIARVLDQSRVGVDGFQVSELRGASIAYSSPDVLIRLKNSLNEKNPSVWKAGDVYSLAVSLCELMKRRSPWHIR